MGCRCRLPKCHETQSGSGRTRYGARHSPTEPSAPSLDNRSKLRNSSSEESAGIRNRKPKGRKARKSGRKPLKFFPRTARTNRVDSCSSVSRFRQFGFTFHSPDQTARGPFVFWPAPPPRKKVDLQITKSKPKNGFYHIIRARRGGSRLPPTPVDHRRASVSFQLGLMNSRVLPAIRAPLVRHVPVWRLEGEHCLAA